MKRRSNRAEKTVNRRNPKMSLITVLLFIAAMATLGFADFATRQTAGRISPALGTLIYAATATVPALIWTMWSRAQAPLLVTRVGGMWSVLTGLAFGIFAGILFFLFSKGVNLSVGTPVIRLGGTAFAAMLGIVVLREGFSVRSLAGFVLAALGILLIATR
jgi:drug/metabolite transporter (DMT)-like permease